MHYAIVDFVTDIAQNACESGASRVGIVFSEDDERVDVIVEDDGKGMGAEQLARALDPFYTDGEKHPGRKVGLGLPFLKQAAEQDGGRFRIRSEKGRGTEVEFGFDKRNVDCPPVGDVPGMLLSALCMPGGHEMTIARRRGSLSYELKKSELIEALGNLEEVSSLTLLKQFLRSQEEG